ncbi:hypothetical protein ACFVT2_03745 [Streptomyces sp. NPDC058000]|uniref:hypothetical protein n=1 Tax=Streptomyces sp. NPDC058000 TaxID=3346299 RepID=UPI0036E3ACC2
MSVAILTRPVSATALRTALGQLAAAATLCGAVAVPAVVVSLDGAAARTAAGAQGNTWPAHPAPVTLAGAFGADDNTWPTRLARQAGTTGTQGNTWPTPLTAARA